MKKNVLVVITDQKGRAFCVSNLEDMAYANIFSINASWTTLEVMNQIDDIVIKGTVDFAIVEEKFIPVDEEAGKINVPFAIRRKFSEVQIVPWSKLKYDQDDKGYMYRVMEEIGE